MGRVNYLSGLGRRWSVIVAALVVALGVGWIMSGEVDQVTAPTGTSFEATTHLLSSTSPTSSVRSTSNLDTVAELAMLGEVPAQVADTMGLDGPAAVTSSVKIVPDNTTGIMAITATGDSATDAQHLADTFARDLVGWLRQRTLDQVRAIDARLQRINQRMGQAQADINQSSSPAASKAAQDQSDSLSFELSLLEQQRSSLLSSGGADLSGFEIIDSAQAHQIVADAGISAPRSRPIRLLIAAGIGLLLGIGLALVLERLDTRIRSKEAAEEAYKLPVLAEVPTIPRRRRRRGSIVAHAYPHALASNAFRLLAAALHVSRRESGVREFTANGSGGTQTILVTSAIPSEGKTTVVANLAATFAQTGKRVVVLCCDLRDSSLQDMLGIEPAPSLAEALGSGSPLPLEGLLQETVLPGVRAVGAGSVPEATGSLFGSGRIPHVIQQARAAGDVVLIDSAPVLAAGDWTPLLVETDSVVVVARAGKTDATTAERTAEILALLQAPVTGVVLNDLPRSAIRRSGYRFRSRHPYRSSKPAEEPAPTTTVALVVPSGRQNGDQEPAESGDGRAAGVPAESPEGIPHLARPSAQD